MENVKKFYEFLKNDPAAGQELQDKFQKIKKTDANAAMTALIEFATQKGFVFTAEDLKQFEESAQVLSDDELQQVSAGAWGLCFTAGVGWGSATDGIKAGTDCYGIGFGMGFADKEVITAEKK